MGRQVSININSARHALPSFQKPVSEWTKGDLFVPAYTRGHPVGQKLTLMQKGFLRPSFECRSSSVPPNSNAWGENSQINFAQMCMLGEPGWKPKWRYSVFMDAACLERDPDLWENARLSVHDPRRRWRHLCRPLKCAQRNRGHHLGFYFHCKIMAKGS